VAYVNQVGGNDDLIFDGRSCAFDGQGRMLARAKGFREDVLLVDLGLGDQSQGTVAEDDFETEAEIWNALVLGVRDYVSKTRFSKVLPGSFRRHRFGPDRSHRGRSRRPGQSPGRADALALFERRQC
jgi:hypothetical protein